MKNILHLLFKCYSAMPYIYYGCLALMACIMFAVDGNIVLNDRFFDMAPLKIMAMACLAGLLLLPVVVVAILVYNRRKYSYLTWPVLSYGLYLAGVLIAGYMGWWTD